MEDFIKHMQESNSISAFCEKCGKPFVSYNTSAETCKCYNVPVNKPIGLVGWICPVCGAGMSPYTDRCLCKSSVGITFQQVTK